MPVIIVLWRRAQTLEFPTQPELLAQQRNEALLFYWLPLTCVVPALKTGDDNSMVGQIQHSAGAVSQQKL
jgi:hypothetical protein